MSRYEARERAATELEQQYTGRLTVYEVWDTVRDMRVAFGKYRTREAAAARVERMEAREAERP